MAGYNATSNQGRLNIRGPGKITVSDQNFGYGVPKLPALDQYGFMARGIAPNLADGPTRQQAQALAPRPQYRQQTASMGQGPSRGRAPEPDTAASLSGPGLYQSYIKGGPGFTGGKGPTYVAYGPKSPQDVLVKQLPPEAAGAMAQSAGFASPESAGLGLSGAAMVSSGKGGSHAVNDARYEAARAGSTAGRKRAGG